MYALTTLKTEVFFLSCSDSKLKSLKEERLLHFLSKDFINNPFFQSNIILLLIDQLSGAGWIYIFSSTCLHKTLITVDTEIIIEREKNEAT